MLRTFAIALVTLLLGLGAWVLLRQERPSGVAVRSTPDTEHVAQPTPAIPAEERRDAQIEPAASTSNRVDEPPRSVANLTGVLAGRLLVDGAPLAEAIELRLDPTDQESPFAARGALRTDALGRFRREGLPADWSGSLHLPEPYRMDVTEGAWRVDVPIERLREDLVIEVMRPPALRLRVLRADRTPAAGAAVTLLQHEDGGSTEMPTYADDQGRVCQRRVAERTLAVEAWARAEDGAHGNTRFGFETLVPTEPLGDIDLGVLVLSGGRRVELRCLAADGEPLSGRSVRVRGERLTEEATTDSTGTLRVGLPWEATLLELQVEGYAGAKTEVPPEVEQHDVTFKTSNLLHVQVVDLSGRPWSGGRLRLSSAGRLLAGDDFAPPGSSTHRSQGLRSGLTARDGVVTSYCLFLLGEDATVEIPDLEVGRDFELRAEDEFGHVGVRVEQVGLGDAERREVRLQLERDACTLEVTVLDLAGRPVPDAAVVARAENVSLKRNSDGNGVLRFPSLLVPTLSLSARSTGLQPAALEHVDPCGGPVTLTLQPARRLVVRLHNAPGQVVEAGRLVLRDVAGSRTFHPLHETTTFEELPFEPLELLWSLCGRERRLEVDAVSESIEFLLPPLGQVEVGIAGHDPVENESLIAVVEALDDPRIDCGPWKIPTTPGSHLSNPLWPGRYRLSTWLLRSGPQSPLEESDFGAPREFVVEAGSTVRVTLEP
ncbi:MAG TPA: carboxypeptidase-like regulatory domain-containing protein [Planctomycetota bacterium]|nr:carboxypeptidase-like regulatory domain-containing protein [Planctomycetota bacterium]